MKQVTTVLAVLFTASCLIFAFSLSHERPSSSKAVDMLKKDLEKANAVEQVEQTETLPTDNVDK